MRRVASPATVRAWSGAVLQAVEVLALISVAGWVGCGAYHYGSDTNWSLRGLLTLLDERWKGTLILVGLLFYRTLQEVIARTKKFSVPWGELGEAVEPVEQPVQVDRPQGQN